MEATTEPGTEGLTRREQWEHRWTRPMMVAATVFLAAYAWPILDPGLPDHWVLVCHVATWTTWALFAVDYVVRLVISTARWRFVRTHVFDLLVVLLPLFRPLGLLRLVAALSVLDRYAGTTLRGRVAIYISGAVSLVIFVAALAALDAERGAEGAMITEFDDAVWWAMTTVTTVGYGDLYPVTDTGRGVAVGLMLCGIALIGVVTASFASWLVERVTEAEAAAEAATRRDVVTLTEEVRALRDEVPPAGAAACRPRVSARPGWTGRHAAA